MTWKKLNEETPIATESGNWDGLRSKPLLVADKNEKMHVVIMYEGFIDGSDFRNFYDEVSDFEVENVIYWTYIPSLF